MGGSNWPGPSGPALQTTSTLQSPPPFLQDPPTLVFAAALVLDDVFMVERAQDVNLSPPAGAELGTAASLEGLHGHHLTSAIVGRVIAVQADFPKVTLARACGGVSPPDSLTPRSPGPPPAKSVQKILGPIYSKLMGPLGAQASLSSSQGLPRS